MEMKNFWALFNTGLAAIMSMIVTIFFVADEGARNAAFGKDYGFVKIDPVATFMASFILALCATILGFVALSLVAVGTPSAVGKAVYINSFATVISLLVFVYFAEVRVSVTSIFGGGASATASPTMTWGPGVNIGASINFFFAVVNTCILKKHLAGEKPCTEQSTVTIATGKPDNDAV